jgi:Asp-tRNA(Asn)/Glu-tRNA(Gln) amidotransferase A subunit family amidase
MFLRIYIATIQPNLLLAGLYALLGATLAGDATVVKLRTNGAIILGKTNCS